MMSDGATLRWPQWSPVVTTGTTRLRAGRPREIPRPQWSPVVTTGTTRRGGRSAFRLSQPQWSPVVTTGTTGADEDLRGTDR